MPHCLHGIIALQAPVSTNRTASSSAASSEVAHPQRLPPPPPPAEDPVDLPPISPFTDSSESELGPSPPDLPLSSYSDDELFYEDICFFLSPGEKMAKPGRPGGKIVMSLADIL